MLSTLLSLNEIFDRKGWHSHPLSEIVLERLTTLLSSTSPDETNLMIELLNRFNWLTPNEIQSSLISVIRSIPVKKFKNKTKLIVFPLLNPDENGKTKSGHHLMYSLSGVLPFFDSCAEISPEYISDYSQLESLAPKESDLFFLIDDYIGSGSTLIETLAEIQKRNSNIEIASLNLIALAVQESSISDLTASGIDFYYNQLEKRGITDFASNLNEIQEKIQLMLQIEKRVPRCGKFSLGFKKSEAIISLTRTPNNTFPIFWKGFKVSGNFIKSPFARF